MGIYLPEPPMFLFYILKSIDNKHSYVITGEEFFKLNEQERDGLEKVVGGVNDGIQALLLSSDYNDTIDQENILETAFDPEEINNDDMPF